jgi:site-specific recombinase XerD
VHPERIAQISYTLLYKNLMSKFRTTHRQIISTGIAIYKTGASPFWYARIWDAQTKRYSTRSTKCIVKADAIEEAFAIRNKLGGMQKAPRVEERYTFAHFAKRQMLIQQRQVQSGQRSPRFVKDDTDLLERPKDGIVSILGKKDIRKITTKDLRDYLTLLDENRESVLSASSVNKHLIVIRKVMNLAREDEVIGQLPVFPKVSTKDTPRPSFSKQEMQQFYKVLGSLAKEDKTRTDAASVYVELYDLCVFLANTGLRPTISEVFSLRHRDITISDDPEEGTHLFIVVKQGKTGFRNTYSTHIAKERYEKLLVRREKVEQDDFVFFPELANRNYAARVAGKYFKLAVQAAGLEKDPLGQNRVLYSLRHYYIQMALAREVPIYELAAYTGTSVQMIERFYGKFPTYSPKQAASLNRGMQKSS